MNNPPLSPFWAFRTIVESVRCTLDAAYGSIGLVRDQLGCVGAANPNMIWRTLILVNRMAYRHQNGGRSFVDVRCPVPIFLSVTLSVLMHAMVNDLTGEYLLSVR
jgi:hypothetical protein